MTWIVHLFTSFDGRISRKSWWIGTVILWIIGITGSLLLSPPALTLDAAPEFRLTLWQSLWGIVLIYPTLALVLKRLNDRDHPRAIGYAWAFLSLVFIPAHHLGFPRTPPDTALWEWALLALVVLFGFWIFIDNGFLKGTPGPNRYGPDPLDGSKKSPPADIRRARGGHIRNAIVVLFGLVIVGIPGWLYYTAPKLLIDSFRKQSSQGWSTPGRTDLEDEMRANAPAWSAFTTGKAVAQKDDAAALDHYSKAIELYGRKSRSAGRVLMWRGHSLRALGRNEEALEDYSTAIAIDPDASAIRYSSRAYIYSKLKRHREALKDFDQAIRLWPEEADYHIGRGNALRELGEYNQALAAYEDAIAAARDMFAFYKWSVRFLSFARFVGILEPAKTNLLEFFRSDRDMAIARAHRFRGRVLRIQKRFDEALAAYDRAVKVEPKDWHSYIGGANAYAESGNHLKAIESYARAIELDPDRASHYVNRGISYRTLGKSEKALADFTRALQVDPDDVHAYRNRGWLYTQQGRLDLARADYERALELTPGDKWLGDALDLLEYPDASLRAQVQAANGLRSRKQHQHALALYNEALQKKPDYAYALLNRGWLYHLQGQLEAALADYVRAVELDSGNADAYVYRGKAYEAMDEFSKADADYEHAFQLQPNHWRAYLWRGWLHHRQEQFDLALADYTRLIELKPRLDDGYLYRGDVYRKRGQLQNAIADYDKALELSPEHVNVYINRGWAHLKQGRLDLARADYERGLELSPDNKWLQDALAHLEKKTRK